MKVNVLITGGSGYLGGSLLDLLTRNQPLPNCGTIHALVRTQEQARQAEAAYRCTAAFIDLSNEAEVWKYLSQHMISVVFFLIDAVNPHNQLTLIKALSAVGSELGIAAHFLHTSGAKLFSGFADHPTDRAIRDTDEDLPSLQAHAQPAIAFAKLVRFASTTPLNALLLILWPQATGTNTAVLEACKASGVRCYIFIPCMVYGEAAGFGNKISIQTVAVVRAAKALRQVCRVDDLDGVRIDAKGGAVTSTDVSSAVLASKPCLRHLDPLRPDPSQDSCRQ